jgi:hypothetical protein
MGNHIFPFCKMAGNDASAAPKWQISTKQADKALFGTYCGG